MRTAPNLAPPPGNQRFPLFDALRAVAALTVFGGHVVSEAATGQPGGGFDPVPSLVARQGVTIFFLISGFLLYRPFLAANRDGRVLGLRGYARRRVLRIIPAYWAALSVLVATGLVYGVTVHNWWRFYGFLQIYSPSTNLGQGISPAWSLCVEVVFYIALPVLAWMTVLGRRRGFSVRREAIVLAGLGLASLVVRALDSPAIHVTRGAASPQVFLLYLATPTYITDLFFWFALGMGLALISVAVEGPISGRASPRLTALCAWLGRHPGPCWTAAVGSFVLLCLISVHNGVFGVAASATLVHVLMGIASLLLVVPAVFAEHARSTVTRVLRSRGLGWIGLVSYGFYLYHLSLTHWLHDRIGLHLTTLGYVALVIGSFALSCAAAALSYYALERPLLVRGRREQLGAQRSAPALPATAAREG